MRGKPDPIHLVAFLLAAVCAAFYWKTGFGADMDAWRVANSGYWLQATGEYQASRRPGYPAVEAWAAMLAYLEFQSRGPGWHVPIIASAAVLGLCGLTLYRLAQAAAARSPLLVTIGFALHPFVFEASGGSFDVVLPTLLLLLALGAALRASPVRLGILLGLMIACRASLLPTALGLLAYFSMTVGRRAIAAWVIAAVIGVLAYAVPLHSFRGHLLPEPLSLRSYPLAWAVLGGYKFLGLPACVLLLGFFGRRSRAPAASVLKVFSDRCFVIVVTTVVVMFLLYPYEPAYLVAALPAALLLIDRIMTLRMRVAWTCALLLNGLIGVPGYTGDARSSTRLRPVQSGQLVALYRQRLAWMDLPDRLELQAAAGRHAYVLDDGLPVLWFFRRLEIGRGDWQPAKSDLRNFNGALHHAGRDRYFVASWDSALIRELTSSGYAISRIRLQDRAALAALRERDPIR